MSGPDVMLFVQRKKGGVHRTSDVPPRYTPPAPPRAKAATLRAFHYSPEKGNVFDWILQKAEQARSKL